MGLDTVELVLEIEDAFSIQIPDAEASQIVTVGDLHKYIVAKLDPTACLSASAFRSLRRAARSLGATERLRPRDSIERLLPATRRRRFWAELQRSAAVRLPRLRRPPWLVMAATLTVTLVTAVVGFGTRQTTQSGVATLAVAVATALCSAGMASLATVPFANLPSPNCATLRGLAEAALRLNFVALAEKHQGANANDVWIALRAIIVEQLGVSPEIVTPTASFVNDLDGG